MKFHDKACSVGLVPETVQVLVYFGSCIASCLRFRLTRWQMKGSWWERPFTQGINVAMIV